MTEPDPQPLDLHRARYAAARAGDPDAFAALLAAHADDLRRFVDRRLGDQARRRFEPEDVLQETSLVLFERMQSFPPDLNPQELLAWFMQIAKHVLVDLVRGMGRDVGESAVPAHEGMDGAQARPDAGTVTRADGTLRLRRAIERLPSSFSAVVRECVLSGRTAAAVATRLGISEENVRQRLCRANVRLRELLSES